MFFLISQSTELDVDFRNRFWTCHHNRYLRTLITICSISLSKTLYLTVRTNHSQTDNVFASSNSSDLKHYRSAPIQLPPNFSAEDLRRCVAKLHPLIILRALRGFKTIVSNVNRMTFLFMNRLRLFSCGRGVPFVGGSACARTGVAQVQMADRP